jgi:phosphoglycolate phosphatase
MPVQALIFDLDGTLVDTAPDLLLATNHALALADRQPITMQQIRQFVGMGAMNLIERGIEATGPELSRPDVIHLHAAMLDYYGANIASESVVFDGLTNLFEQAKSHGLQLGVCTNKIENLSRKLLKELSIDHLFGSVIGGDTLPVMKPDPEPLRAAARKIGVDPANVIMFGDSETDIRTAQNAGVPVIAVTFGYTTQHVSAFNPTHVIDHYDQAWQVVQSYL